MSWNKRPGRWPKRPPPSPGPPPPPLGDIVRVIRLEDLEKDVSNNKADAKITDVATIASFSWVNNNEPAVLIPGKPPRWAPLPGTTVLQPDKGPVYRDDNASHYPPHPLEPAVIAVLDADPGLPREVDIVCCGSTMGNLLRFARRRELEAAMANSRFPVPAIKPFRFLVERVGSTVFFTRRENDPMAKIEPLIGFGHSFPEAYTTWEEGCEGSASNQRVLWYRFGGMRLVVRFECDGYIPSAVENAERNRKDKGIVNNEAKLEELATALGKTSVSTGSALTAFADAKKIKITRTSDSLVPQSQIFDLKTRSWRKKGVDVLGEVIQRLWIAQISNFVLAFHEDGRFSEEDISVTAVGSRVKKWEEEHEEDLRHLGALLRQLVQTVKLLGKVEVCYDPQNNNGPGEGKELLVLREMLESAGTVLSQDTKRRWLEGLANKEVEARRQRVRDTIYGGRLELLTDSDDEELDYTACSVDSCGYCGRCSY